MEPAYSAVIPAQSSLIVKKPGSGSQYYIFTLDGAAGNLGLNYSIVDMTAGGGLGAVTIKNAAIYNAACTEKMTGTRHCNGRDYWIVIHEHNSSNFRSYLLTSAGVNTTAVISNVGTYYFNYMLCMKISPTGNKLASLFKHGGNGDSNVELYDFDSNTGTLSNFTLLSSTIRLPYSLEFSPDGSKLYTMVSGGISNSHPLYQWDLCAGNNAAVIASEYTVSADLSNGTQLAKDGKIYFIHGGNYSISVVHNPNAAGAACNFVLFGQDLGGKQGDVGLPNFISEFTPDIPPFSYSVSPSAGCHAISFTANIPAVSCMASNYSVTSLKWDFGNAASGAANTSTLSNPLHVYSSSGTYTASLIFYYKCGSDTIKQIVNVPPPYIAVTWTASCDNLASATATAIGGIGPYSYSWSPAAKSGSLVSNLGAGSYSVVLTDHGLGCKAGTVIAISTKIPPVFTVTSASHFSLCTGQSHTLSIKGNAAIYTWSPNTGIVMSGSQVIVSPQHSQDYLLTGTLDGCSDTLTVKTSVLPLPAAMINSEKQIFCLNDELKLSGEGGVKYKWLGPAGFKSEQQHVNYKIQGEQAAGTYSLEVTDLHGCKNTAFILISLQNPPQGILDGYVSSGCVPFCSDYIFRRTQSGASVITQWEINKQKFGEQFTYCYDVAGSYLINGTLKDTISGCESKISYSVLAHAPPLAAFKFEPLQPVELFDEVSFVNTSQGNDQRSWNWYMLQEGHRTFKSSGEYFTFVFPQAGVYPLALVVKNKWGCADTTMKSIHIGEDFGVYIPNSFTPNEDGRNDAFLPMIRGAKNIHLRIFDRWGQLVFECADCMHGWDGLSKGSVCKADVYIYKIEIKTEAGKNVIKQGHVTLIR